MQNKTQCCCFAAPIFSKLPFAHIEEKTSFDKLKMKLAVEIEEMRKKGVTTFLTGMAWGPDLLAAELVLDLKRAYPDQEINLISMIPYAGQSNRWPEEYRKRYYAVLQMADETIALQSHYTPRCLLQCSRCMIDNSAHMIAVYGGEQGIIINIMEYAYKKGLDVAVIRPKG